MKSLIHILYISGRRFIHPCALAALMILCAWSAEARVLDEVVAYIDSTAITRNELNAEIALLKQRGLYESDLNTLEKMINRYLIVLEARRLKLTADNDEELVLKFIDLHIRSLVIIKEGAIDEYFKENKKKLGKARIKDVRGMIRDILVEEEVNKRLIQHIATRKKDMKIKIMLESTPSLY